MAQNITLLGASYPDVPAVELPKTGGGTALFSDPSLTTATADDVADGKDFLLADGTYTRGTAQKGVGWFGTSSTAGGTVKKETSITDFPTTLTDGLKVSVRFANANTVASPTLSINSGTAVGIRRYGTTTPGTSAAVSWQSGTIVQMTYYSGYWYIDNWLNTTYSEISAANIESLTGSTTGTITGRRFTSGFNKRLTSAAIGTALGYTAQSTGNLVTSVSSSSTDDEYPSAKLFYDTVGDIATLLAALR